MERQVTIAKLDGDLQLVYGEVYAPVTFPDSDGDIMTASEIRKIAHKFISTGKIENIDLMHDQTPSGSKVVESFIAREGDPDFIPGSWVLGVKVESEDLWSLIKKGEINGFSMEIEAVAVPVEIEIDVPESLTGRTEISKSHSHEFVARFGPDGTFLGGETDEVVIDGVAHRHSIKRGTATEASDDHTHRFSIPDLLSQLNPVITESS